MMISKKFLNAIKDFVNLERFSGGVSKVFLEGAYKIMIFAKSSVISKDRITLDGNKMERNVLEGMKESIEVTNLIQKLFTRDDVLSNFILENREVVEEYLEEEDKVAKTATEAEDIMNKIEKEAQGIQKLAI